MARLIIAAGAETSLCAFDIPGSAAARPVVRSSTAPIFPCMSELRREAAELARLVGEGERLRTRHRHVPIRGAIGRARAGQSARAILEGVLSQDNCGVDELSLFSLRGTRNRFPGARALAAGACFVASASGVRAQILPRPQPAPIAAHDSIVISVVTMGPGDEVFERFGHQSIRIHDITSRLGDPCAHTTGESLEISSKSIARPLASGDMPYWMRVYDI